MNILKGRVNWKDGWDNNPRLELLVDEIPSKDSLRYEERNDLYYAEHNGYVSFYFYTQPGNGFGGTIFDIVMKNGTERSLKGPWSSRAGVANRLGFGPCLDVSLTDKLEAFERGYTFYAGHCSLELIKKAMNRIEIGSGYGFEKPHWSVHKEFVFPEGSKLAFYKYESDEDIVYEPVVLFPDGDIWIKDERVRD